MLKTYKQSGVVVAILAIIFAVLRGLDTTTWKSFFIDVLLYTIPGLLFAYGLYVWDDKPKAEERNEDEKLGERE